MHPEDRARERDRTLLERAEALAGMGSWELDLASGAVRASEGMRCLLGLAQAVPYSLEAFRACIHPEDRERVEAQLARADAPQTRLDLRIVRPDGAMRILRCESQLDAGLGVRRGVVLDVTEEQRAQQELHRSEQRLRALLNQRIELAAFVALDGTLLEPNERALAFCGAKRGDVVGRPFWETPWWAHDPALRAQLREAVARAAAGEFVRFDARHPRVDGSMGVVDFSLAPIAGSDGRPELLFAESIEITEQLETRRALERSRERNAELLRLLEDAPDGFYLIDARTHRFLWASAGARRNLGYELHELEAMTCADLSPDLDACRLDELLAPLVRGEVEGVEISTSHRRKDASQYPIDVRYTRVRHRGEPALLAVAVETSERRYLEAQLLQSQKLEALGTLASGVAHDFNNLLTTIRGSAELLLGQLEAGSRAERTARRVLVAAERGAQLTSQLLAYSRGSPQQRERLDPSAAVREVRELLGRTLGEDIRFEVALAPDAWPVDADPGQINQVLVNLVVNARDSMPSGGRLRVETANAPLDAAAAGALDLPAGDYVRIDVSDTGTGMTPEVQARIFDPFFTTKRPGKGTGLGLATVLRIVRAHGGRLRLESRVGEGSRFQIWLPRAPGGKPSQAPGSSVLIVERDEILRDSIAEVLEDAGYRVRATGSTRTALGAARETGFDLVIAARDHEALAGLGGYESPLPLLCLVDCADAQPVASGAASLAKPFTNDALLAAVRRALESRESRAAGAPRTA